MERERFGACAALAVVVTFAAFGAVACGVNEESSQEETSESSSQTIKNGQPATSFTEAALIDGPGFICSGAVIAPKVALTAGHCVTGASSWTVRTPYGGNQSAHGSSAWTQYVSTGTNVNPNTSDVALIFLDTPINLAAYPPIASAEYTNGTAATNVGRIQNNVASSTQLFFGATVTLTDATLVRLSVRLHVDRDHRARRFRRSGVHRHRSGPRDRGRQLGCGKRQAGARAHLRRLLLQGEVPARPTSTRPRRSTHDDAGHRTHHLRHRDQHRRLLRLRRGRQDDHAEPVDEQHHVGASQLGHPAGGVRGAQLASESMPCSRNTCLALRRASPRTSATVRRRVAVGAAGDAADVREPGERGQPAAGEVHAVDGDLARGVGERERGGQRAQQGRPAGLGAADDGACGRRRG